MAELTGFPFLEWVNYTFDQPVTKRQWYWDEALDERWDTYITPRVAFAYFVRLLRDPTLLAPFTRKQIAQGLNFLLSGVFLCGALRSDELDVSVAEGDDCIDAIVQFFRDWVAPLGLGSGLRGEDPLAAVLYMWWDIWSWGGIGSDEHVLGAMQELLALPCLVCRETALHALGHWRLESAMDAQAIERIVDDFIACTPNLSDELREYATRVRRGDVL
jgi:hypothetical protein